MTRNTLLIITGLPYSGKTTLTKKLAEKFDLAETSIDKFLEGKYIVSKMSQQDWNDVYAQGYGELELLLSHGKNVVFDGGSLKRTERDLLKQIAQKYNASCSLIYVMAPREEIIKRWKDNQQTKQRGHLEEETLNKAFSMFEEPAQDEKPIIYKSGDELEKWIKENPLL